jgi:hypothetical protein
MDDDRRRHDRKDGRQQCRTDDAVDPRGDEGQQHGSPHLVLGVTHVRDHETADHLAEQEAETETEHARMLLEERRMSEHPTPAADREDDEWNQLRERTTPLGHLLRYLIRTANTGSTTARGAASMREYSTRCAVLRCLRMLHSRLRVCDMRTDFPMSVNTMPTQPMMSGMELVGQSAMNVPLKSIGKDVAKFVK